MRRMAFGVTIVLLSLQASPVGAEEARKTSERVLTGVISGLLGQPQDATFTAQERDRLVSLLQRGEYATSRQGETVDLMVFGVPLTSTAHVYTATPIPPSRTGSRSDQP
ncbi:MAG: hypothetical protein HYZ91_03295 [Candidatus Omnitrophica bacterium]|nr:hypothetical protein [Candidatus Omnitrophota bacterium]